MELTPTQLHIFEAVGTAKSSEGGAASSLTWSTRPSGDQEFNKGKVIKLILSAQIIKSSGVQRIIILVDRILIFVAA